MGMSEALAMAIDSISNLILISTEPDDDVTHRLWMWMWILIGVM